jgi:predicted RNA binding protein YcfA (HicA-like mRNA interferase family)
VKYREVVGKLSRLGCEELPRRGGGSHRKWYNPTTKQIAAIPDWGSKDLKAGTVRAIIRQLGIENQIFEEV